MLSKNLKMHKEKGIIKYILAVVAVLAVVFISQQNLFRGTTQTFYNGFSEKVKRSLAGATSWVNANAVPQISSEVKKGGEALKEGASQAKEQVTQNVAEKAKNYFSGIVDSILGKNNSVNSNCNVNQ